MIDKNKIIYPELKKVDVPNIIDDYSDSDGICYFAGLNIGWCKCEFCQKGNYHAIEKRN